MGHIPTKFPPVLLCLAKGLNLKWHCHGNFFVLWSKLFKYLTRNLFSYVKFLLEHQEEINKWFFRGRTNYNQFLAISVKCTGQTWKSWPIFSSCNPFSSKPSVVNTSLCALLGQPLTKRDYYFNVPITTNMFLAIQSYTKNRWHCCFNHQQQSFSQVLNYITLMITLENTASNHLPCLGMLPLCLVAGAVQ